MFSKLRYASDVSLDPAAAAAASYVFCANGLYDPDTTGTGHQPYGFDQAMAIYSRYRVRKSVCKVRPLVQATTSVNTSLVGIVLSQDGLAVSGASSVENILEFPTPRISKLLRGGSVWEPFRQTVLQYRESQLIGDEPGMFITSGTLSTNPPIPFYFEVFAAAPGATDPGAVTCQVEIEYEVEFYEKKLLPSS
jgi:hypothetical protein